MKIGLFFSLLFTGFLHAAPDAPVNTAPASAVVKIHQQRVDLLRGELKAQDARIEARVDAIVTALKSITDSKDSRTKVTRLKENTIEALTKNLAYFRQKRAALIEELRRPTLNLTADQKRKGIEVFNERMEKRVSQILALQKSFPTHQDYARHKVHHDDDFGSNYTVNEDFKQNQRLTTRTNAQRSELEAELRKSISRIEQQNGAIQAQGGLPAELAKNEALLAERRQQLKDLLTPSTVSGRSVGKSEAADLDQALRKATTELREEFNTLFSRYNALINALSALNTAKS